jgi:hypothetical protein
VRSSRRARWVGTVALVAAAALAAARGQDDEDLRVLRREGSPRQLVFGNVLSRELGLRLVGVEAVLHRARWGGRAFEGTGPCVALDGLEVTRLLFEKPLDALDYLVHVARPGRTPLVADARGRQLVMITGRRSLSPERAARVLGAAWGDQVIDAPDRPIEALRVTSPPLDEGAAAEVAYDGALFLGRGDTPAWRHSLQKLKAARQYAASAPAPGGPLVQFRSTNHFTFVPAAGGYSEVVMTRHGAVETVGRTAERCRVLVTYGRDLLEVLGAGAQEADSPRGRMLEVVQHLLAPPGDPAPATDDLGDGSGQ